VLQNAESCAVREVFGAASGEQKMALGKVKPVEKSKAA
jgi:hypothetical protein